MRPRLQCTNLLVHDLADQPEAAYIVLVEGILGPGSKGALAVTHYKERDGVFAFYHGEECVLVLPYDVRWSMIARDRILAPTTEEWVRKDAADTQAILDLKKELHPGEKEEPGAGMSLPFVVFGAEGQPGDTGRGYL